MYSLYYIYANVFQQLHIKNKKMYLSEEKIQISKTLLFDKKVELP